MAEVWRRILLEWRVRLPLLALFSAAWGFLLVAVYAWLDDPAASLGPTQVRSALRLVGIDPLAAWIGLGQDHPLFLGATSLFVLGGGVRAIAGELEGGTLELALGRPLSRSRYLASYALALAPGAVLLAAGYGAGCLLGARLLRPEPGDLRAGPVAAAALLTALLLLAIAGYSLLCSSLAEERGRALAWAAGLTIVMYAWGFLAPLVAALRPFARLSLWDYYAPSRVVAGGSFPWGDAAVLLAVAVASGGLAWLSFLRRDLA
jgi:ABC-type transport system involved in multi-copper enzyme maturation permease subunit